MRVTRTELLDELDLLTTPRDAPQA